MASNPVEFNGTFLLNRGQYRGRAGLFCVRDGACVRQVVLEPAATHVVHRALPWRRCAHPVAVENVGWLVRVF